MVGRTTVAGHWLLVTLQQGQPTLLKELAGVLQELKTTDLVAIGGVLVTAYVIARLIDSAMTALADRLLVYRFRLTVLIPMVKAIVYILAGYTIVFFTINPSQQQLTAFAGLFGAALGFGLRDLVADVLGGLLLVIERPYRIGDKVTIGEHYGEVVDIGFLSTRLVTDDDTLITIPNSVCVSESVANANAGNAEMLVAVEFHVHPRSDTAVARRIVEEALLTSRYVYVTDDLPVTVRVEDDRHYTTIKGKAYVHDLRSELGFRSDVTERVLAAFAEEGIRSPPAVPHSDPAEVAVRQD